MVGLDSNVIKLLEPERTLGRVCSDVKSDFILSPHYQAIYKHIGEELWDQLIATLRSGTFEPALPITIDVPKETAITRPISILEPFDRLVYQAIADVLAPPVEEDINRSMVFSCVLLEPDPEYQMFADHTECWSQLQAQMRKYCEDGRWTHAIKADISNFFERIRQHTLVNLLRATGCISGAVNLLEELLLAWMERNSHGILQGMLPSDLLGNFFLVGLDAEIELSGAPHLRYVDDLYVFYDTRREAQRDMVELCKYLRSEGLNLNPSKSSILPAENLLREETQLDQMFEAARIEVKAEMTGGGPTFYGFQLGWTDTDEEPLEEEVHLRAVEALYKEIQKPGSPRDRIERFCLPALGAAGSDIGVEQALAGLLERPHLAKHYSSYLWRVGRSNQDIQSQLAQILVSGEFTSDWQAMWPIAALLYMHNVNKAAVKRVLSLLRDKRHAECLRAICALFVGKHGSAAQRRGLRHQYKDEPSDYVRSAILFTSQHLPAAERRTSLKAWGGHSRINSLVAKAVRKMVA